MTNPTNQASGVAEPDDERAPSTGPMLPGGVSALFMKAMRFSGDVKKSKDDTYSITLTDAQLEALFLANSLQSVPEIPSDAALLRLAESIEVESLDELSGARWRRKFAEGILGAPPVAQPAIPAVEVASAAPSSLGVLDEMEWRKCAEAAMKVAGEAIAKLDALKPMLVGAHARLQLASVCVDIQSMYLLRAYVEQRAPTPHPAVAVPGSLTDALERLVHDVRDLMENSEGVAGLHMNGDLAPWSELKESGRYSSWLGDALEQADAALATTSTASQPENEVKP